MRTFIAFLKKELLESWRCGKIAIAFALFLLFGAMNPAIAKITPWLLDVMSESLEASGMIIGEVTADVGASWTQFYKNIPIALIAFVMIFGGSFTKEYDKGTLVLVLTKGLERYKVVLAKAILMLITWTIGFWFCFGVTYAGNMIFWTNESISALVFSAFCWWLFGLWTVCLTILFSVLFKSYPFVLLGTGGCVFASYIIGVFPKVNEIVPTWLMSGSSVLFGVAEMSDFTVSIIVVSVISLACLCVSIPIMNKKEI